MYCLLALGRHYLKGDEGVPKNLVRLAAANENHPGDEVAHVPTVTKVQFVELPLGDGKRPGQFPVDTARAFEKLLLGDNCLNAVSDQKISVGEAPEGRQRLLVIGTAEAAAQ